MNDDLKCWVLRQLACLIAVAACIGVVIESSTDQRSRAADPPAIRRRFAAVAFDYFVLFNPDSVVSAVERIAPGKGRDFTNVWRTRQFEYSWLRSITNRYVDFSAVTEDALVYTAAAMGVQMTAAQRRQLVDAYSQLTPWPDTADALRRLQAAHARVIALANFSPAMLRANAERAGLSSFFESLVSTDANQTYKPDARAYQLGLDQLRLPKEEVVFAAFGGWDAAGAKSFGYPTVWVNRFHQPPEELGAVPDWTVTDLKGLLEIVLGAP